MGLKIALSPSHWNKIHFLLPVNPLSLLVEIRSTLVMSLSALALSAILESSSGGCETGLWASLVLGNSEIF